MGKADGDVADKLLSFLNRLHMVEKLSISPIKSSPPIDQQSIAVSKESGRVVLVTVRDVDRSQALRIYTSGAEMIEAQIRCFARKQGWGVS